MSRPEITAYAFDRLTARRPDRILWTLPTIAQRIGTSADFVRDTLAKVEGSPVRFLGGRFYAYEDELEAFMRSEERRPG